MLRGLLIDRRTWTMILGGVILITRALGNMGLGGHPVVAFFIDPIIVFALVMVAMGIWLYPLLRPHWISAVLITGAVILDYMFVYAFYLTV